ncbi:MAG TPA: M50 family metallopeptidase [Chloroflexia bacterium]|nr:M50 family metallopeptidase [Chloroflexia bacterium]
MSRFFTGFARNRLFSATAARGLDAEFIIGMTLAIAAVVVLWWTPLLFPFRIFTTSAHEIGHALAAFLMGGSASDIQLFWNGGGVTRITYNGTLAGIVVYSAGYLGSVIFGGLLLLRAKKAAARRQTLWFITIALAVVTVFFIRDLQSLLLVAIVAGLSGLAAWKAPNLLVTFIIYVLALLSCLYSLMDLFFVITATGNPFHSGFNDAIGLASLTPIPAFVWALIWGLVGGFMMFMFARIAIRKGPAPKDSGSKFPGTSYDPKSPFDRYDDYLSKR